MRYGTTRDYVSAVWGWSRRSVTSVQVPRSGSPQYQPTTISLSISPDFRDYITLAALTLFCSSTLRARLRKIPQRVAKARIPSCHHLALMEALTNSSSIGAFHYRKNIVLFHQFNRFPSGSISVSDAQFLDRTSPIQASSSCPIFPMSS